MKTNNCNVREQKKMLPKFHCFEFDLLNDKLYNKSWHILARQAAVDWFWISVYLLHNLLQALDLGFFLYNVSQQIHNKSK